MSWFDKLFGESSGKETHHTHDNLNEDDVYRRPRGKFRFPLNVDTIKTTEDHIERDVESKELYEDNNSVRYETYIDETYESNIDVNTEAIRTSFTTDYVPRRERRRGRDIVKQTKTGKSHQSETTYERYQPKTKLNDAPKYSSYQSKSNNNTTTNTPGLSNNQSFTEKQYSVHQPKFKASVVPSAIYGTKPRKDPSILKQPVNSIQPIQGKKAEDVRPSTPTHRKEDNTVNIENVYASQIVAEIRREREKKLQRKKQFELEREQIKLQHEEISSMMHEEQPEIEYLHVDSNDQSFEERVTIIEEDLMERGPVVNQINLTDNQESIEEIIEIEDSTEVITLNEGESYTYSTKSPFSEHETKSETSNRLTIIEASEEEVETIEDKLELDELETYQDTFLDENVTFEQDDEPIKDIGDNYEDIDEDFSEDFIIEEQDIETEGEIVDEDTSQLEKVEEGSRASVLVQPESLEPTLMPDIKPALNETEPKLEYITEVEVIEQIDEASLEPVIPIIEEPDEIVEETTSDEITKEHDTQAQVVTGNIREHLSVGQSHYVQVENNEITANIRDHAEEPVISPKPKVEKKVSPFNVLMTPSDKRRLLDKKKAVQQVNQEINNENETISQDIQRSFEQQGSINSEVKSETDAEDNIIEVTETKVVGESDSKPIQQTIVSNNGYPLKKEPTKRIGPKYMLPPVSLLNPEDKLERDETWVEEHKAQLDDAFYHFNVPAKVENVVVGPSVTRFELSVEKGVKVSRITNLQDDIKMALAAKDIRIEAPIPGTSLVGVEVPNIETRNVNLSEVLFSKKMKFAESKLTVALGARINNEPMIMDLAKMPHGLIAGATGSGKSVCINSILVSLLYRNNPNELKLLLIDPKMVELAPYNDLPHLIAPVITDVKAATESLKWVVEEMERRYKIFADIHVRNITAYNQKVSYVERLPKIVIVIDELADLMMMSPQDVEHSIARIAQKARAAGIHMILATQRPSVNVITGLIKANVPTRVAFMVSSAVDSRTIIDGGGAEKLLGNGDMLYLGNGMNKPIRIQGNYVSDEEIDAVVQYVKTQGEPNYLFQEKELLKKVSEAPKDELFKEICDFMIDEGHISTSQIQRRFQIGYNRAARIIDQLEDMGYVSGQNGSKPRAVLITEKQEDY
ncbi:DNA translocase FtsK [Macrococcus sp. EM39E]|uniref:DNA translocase FtsK n=1 Tax=Macrococcus animalis TaxID=3395467 RepID=UPI0039BDDE2A